jgi:hypothetical protein
MPNSAEQTAKNAEADSTNDPGYCLQQCRMWAGIGSMYPDASTAWRNTNDRHPGDMNAPRGSAVYWTGGSHGYGHIAISVGGGKVRSTDAGGSGHVATVSIGWVHDHWGLPYAGWAWDINEQTIGHGDEEDEVKDEDIEAIASRVNKTLGDYKADGKERDPSNKDPDQGNARLSQIEQVVRRLEDKVDKLLDKK